jgi:iron complex outermembrane receptor protein
MQNPIYFMFVLLLITSAVTAEEATHLDTLTVTARPPGMGNLEHIAQPIDILGGEKLNRIKAASIGETLAHEPGVTETAFGPYASRPIIRGLGGARVLMLQNGISSMDVSTISVDHPVTIEPFQAQQIEIFRGPATLLYGSGASGGLVNVVTGRIPEYIPESFSASAESRINSANQEKLFAFRAEGGVDDVLALHVDGTVRNANDYESADGEIQNSAYDNRDFNLGASYFIGRGFLGFSFGRFNSTHGIPLNPDEPDELPFIDTTQDRVEFAGGMDDPLPGFSGLRLRAAHNDYQHIEFEGPGEPPGTTFINDEWEGRLELQHKPLGIWTGSLGAQFNLRSLSAAGDEAFIVPVKSHGYALFLLEETDAGNWHFELGGRYEHKKYEPSALSTFSPVAHDVYSIAGGAHWHFLADHSLGFSVSRGQRVPSEEELFADGPHLATGTFEIGNPGLGEETSNNIDLSLKKETGGWTWGVNLFVNYIEDFIFLSEFDRDGDGAPDFVDEDGVAPGELLLTRIEQDNALFYGIEAETVFGLMQNKRGNLDLRLFGDYVRGQRDGGDNLPRISPPRLGAGLIYNKAAWTANLDLINVFKQDDVAGLETGTGGHVLLNAGLLYAFRTGGGAADSSVFLRANNLLDEDARRHTSFLKDRAPLPGRSVMLGVQLNY